LAASCPAHPTCRVPSRAPQQEKKHKPEKRPGEFILPRQLEKTTKGEL
jgi:hypothetical protein